MQTKIVYNGVTIQDVLTESIEHTDAKDSTGVDQLGVRIVATFTGVVHSAPATVGVTGVKVQTLRAGLADLMKSLTKDRRRFQLIIGSTVIYDIAPGAAESNAPRTNIATTLDRSDIDNGPKPSVTILKITAGITATIRFTIECLIPNCGDSRNPTTTSGLVNFRFWIAEDIDCRTWLTSRTYTGRIRVAHKNISPHAVADVVTVPPLESGFIRRIMQWHESSDGLHLDFTIQDQETVAMPPYNGIAKYGATDWRGQMSLSTDNFGATSTAEITVGLTGAKSTSIEALEYLALRVIQAKLQWTETIDKQKGFLQYFGIVEQLAENSIEVACRILITGDRKGAVGGLHSIAGRSLLGQPMGNLGINYDSNVAFTPLPTAGIAGVFLSLLQTPCSPGKFPTAATTRRQRQRIRAQADTPPPQPTSPGEQIESSDLSASQLDAMYFQYLLDSEIRLGSGKIALATGAAANSPASTPSLVVVNLHRPTAMRQIYIDAIRLNMPIELPRPNVVFSDKNGIDHTMVGEAEILPSVPQLSADSRKLLFQTKMRALYAMSRAPGLNESLPVGALPYRATALNDPSRMIAPEFFVDPKSILT